MSVKCPYCEELTSHFDIKSVDINLKFKRAYRGVSYECPRCKNVISVGMDPIALKTDIVKEVVAALKKR